MARLRPVTFLCLVTLLTLSVAFYKDAPVAAKDSAQAALPAHLLSLLSVTAAPNLALQAASGTPDAKAVDPLPEGKGKDLTKKLCSGCHALTIVAQKRHTEEEWDAILVRMLGKGLEASDDDMDTIHDYLVTYLGPVKEGSSDTPPDSSSPR